eukprot:10168380-Heterocapsa_arctica.AAC.1
MGQPDPSEEGTASQVPQTLVGPPFCAWEEFRRRPATYAAWATICVEDWTPLGASGSAQAPHATSTTLSIAAPQKTILRTAP